MPLSLYLLPSCLRAFSQKPGTQQSEKNATGPAKCKAPVRPGPDTDPSPQGLRFIVSLSSASALESLALLPATVTR